MDGSLSSLQSDVPSKESDDRIGLRPILFMWVAFFSAIGFCLVDDMPVVLIGLCGLAARIGSSVFPMENTDFRDFIIVFCGAAFSHLKFPSFWFRVLMVFEELAISHSVSAAARTLCE